MYKNCILIGGAGFIGTNLAKGLLSEGYSVTVVDKLLSRFFTQSGIIDKVSFCRCDYLDLEELKPAIKNQEILLHFAYSSLPGSPINSMENDVKDNVLGSIRLFKFAAENGVKKIIFPSSGGTVYGDAGKSPIKESSPADPICFHGISKLMIEKYLFLFKRTFGVDYLLYRISNAYGPGQNPDSGQGLIPNVISRIYKDEQINIFGDGKAVRDYIYIDDIVKAFMSGIKYDLKNDVFNIGTGIGYSINEIIDNISRTLSVRPKIVYSDKRITDVRSNVLNTDKIRSITGWKSEISIEEGIKKTCQWIKGIITV